MSQQPSFNFTLGSAVEQYLGLPPATKSQKVTSLRALLNWYRTVALLFPDDGCESEFESVLTSSHIRSFRLLWEFWTAQYNEPHLSAAYIQDLIEEASGKDIVKNQLTTLNIENSLQAPETFGWERIQRLLKPRATLSHNVDHRANVACSSPAADYHKAATQLFSAEFGNWSTYDMEGSEDHYDAIVQDLDSDRKRLCESAFVLATSVACYNSFNRQLSATALDQEAEWPHYVDTNQNLPWYPSAASSPVFRACPWLDETEQVMANAPYYLWDVTAQQTVVVKDLPEFPDYTAVSHTWGRWIIEGAEKVKLPNVPWEIPQNSRFDVEALPSLLDELPTLTPYVWFDLVCIPQDGGPLAQLEISRQAVIFQHALHAAAWVNEITDLSSIAAVSQWICLSLIGFKSDTSEERNRQKMLGDRWQELADDTTGLLTHSVDGKQLVANNWSTSLWTLQEVCLRPDMWICARDFTYLSLEEGVSLTVSGLVSLFNAFHDSTSTPQLYQALGSQIYRYPAVWELQCWLTLSGLDKLTDMSRLDVLALGDRRKCTERRAEATMSAMGVCKWYTAVLSGSERRETDLILGKYPLAYVRETCVHNPGEFFGGYLKDSISPIQLTTQDQLPPQDAMVSAPQVTPADLQVSIAATDAGIVSEGSLLPFSRDDCYYTKLSFSAGVLATHPSVRGWTVNIDGSVFLPEACIISSPDIVQCSRSDNHQNILAAALLGTSLHGARKLTPSQMPMADLDVDLHDFVRKYPTPACAVVVQYQRNLTRDTPSILMTGVLLRSHDDPEAITEQNHLMPRTWVKFANFAATVRERQLQLPLSTRVDWTVK